jgi:hypothetical protein
MKKDKHYYRVRSFIVGTADNDVGERVFSYKLNHADIDNIVGVDAAFGVLRTLQEQDAGVAETKLRECESMMYEVIGPGNTIMASEGNKFRGE